MLDQDQVEIQTSASYFIPAVEAMRPVQAQRVTPTLFGVGKQVPWKLEKNVPSLVSRLLTCGTWNNWPSSGESSKTVYTFCIFCAYLIKQGQSSSLLKLLKWIYTPLSINAVVLLFDFVLKRVMKTENKLVLLVEMLKYSYKIFEPIMRIFS